MKKRLLSWLMVLTLCLTLLPTAALADTGAGESSGSEKHEHYLCGTSHTCANTQDSEREFTEWTDALAQERYGAGSTAANSLPVDGPASYYLTQDVELTETWKPYAYITLCLNGHSITMKGDRSVISSSGTFTLVDCKGDSHDDKYGKITHASGYKGHGVELTGGTFTMYGGNITGNTASSGGGVYMTGRSTFNLYGGQITSNTATGSGGGVYSEYGTNHNSTFNMYGGQIADNNGNIGGGGVFYGNGTFTMRGGEISGNKGGGGRSKNGGGGVCIVGAMTVSGDVEITGNTEVTDSVSTNNNVYLRGSDAVITIDGALTGGAGSIGVSTSTKLKAGESVKIAEGKNYTLTDNDLKAFSSDAGDPYQIRQSENTLLLANTADAPHKHFLCTTGNTCTKVGGHTENGKTTFATKLWYDEDQQKLMMGTDEWKSTNIELYENYYVDYYVLEAGSYYLNSDISLEHSIRISGDVQLCLNGFSIISDGTVTGRHVIIVEGSSLTLTGCKGSGKITHADGKNGGGVSVYNPSSVFNMFGGIITGNNMYGGVKNNGTFNMYGGEISGNTATNCGGGVYVAEYSTAFKVSGAAKITGNTVDEKANNVYLPSGKTIAISGLTGGANIGVTTAEKPEGSKTVTIASSVGELNYENYVKTDDSEKYEVKRSNGDLVLAVKNGGTTPAKHEHYLCGGDSCTCPADHKKDGVTKFQPWTDELAQQQNGNSATAATSLPKVKGNYYLTDNVTLVDSYWEPKSGTVLCLNGYSITRNRTTTKGYVQNYGVINITGSFTLADCKGEQGEYGKITHGKDADNSTYPGRGVSVYDGSFTMYGGNITGNKTSGSTWGSGVFVGNFGGNKGSFAMYGGKISGNTAPQGGGVYVRDNFTMYGGEISGNEANYSGGGGVVVENDGTFTMKNGTISDNAVNGTGCTYYGGGGVDVNYGGTFTMEGGTISRNKYTAIDGAYVGGGGVHVRVNLEPNKSYTPFIMKGGTISDNETNFTGGGVYVGEGTTFTMEGGTISNNKAVTVGPNRSGGGGGVYAYGSFAMTGGEISGNSAANNGGGVCAMGKLIMSGGTIGGTGEGKANTAGDNGGGVCMFTSGMSSTSACIVSGNVTIIGNKKSSDGTANNVYLPSGKTITIGGALTGEAGSIGVTPSSWPTGTATKKIATQATDGDQNYVKSDDNAYEVKYDNDNGNLVLGLKGSNPQPGKTDAKVSFVETPTATTYGDADFNITAKVETQGANASWSWSSSNDSILKVTGSGSAATVKALKSGEATITVTYESENAKGTATATITVNKREISVKADNKTIRR